MMNSWGRNPALGLALCMALDLFGLGVSPVRAAELEFPKRKSGLWEIRSTGAQANGLAPTRYCVGEATDRADQHLDRATGTRGACTLGAFRKAGEGWLAESVCRESKTVVRSRALATGNLTDNYRIDTVVSYDPPLAGTRREDREAVVATYLGDCLAGQKPGDMVIPGMGTLNMVDGHFKGEAAPTRPRNSRQSRNTSDAPR
jgi:hypothetical protein